MVNANDQHFKNIVIFTVEFSTFSKYEHLDWIVVVIFLAENTVQLDFQANNGTSILFDESSAKFQIM